MANDVKITLLTKLNEEGIKKLRSSLGQVKGDLTKLGIGVAGAGVAIAGGLAVAGKEALDFGSDTTKALDAFANQTGVARGELEEYKAIALDVFAGNYGQDIGDVAKAMAEVKNATGLTGEALEDTTRNALILRDNFGQDVAKSINSVDTLMNQFGLTSNEAFDFLTFGLQNGLDKSGDFLDSIGEYSNLFAQSGASAEQFYSLLESGSQGGVLGTDKAADAFKEFQIRFLEGDKAMLSAIEDLTGDGWGMFIQEIESGDTTVANTFDLFTRLLGEMKDPIEANRIGVSLFGTQFEDLGLAAVTGLTLATENIDKMANSTEQAGQTGRSLGEQWDAAMRQFLVSAEPAAAEILPLLVRGIQMAGEFLKESAPVFSAFAVDLKDNMGPAMALITDALKRISIAFGDATEETTGMEVALNILDTGLGVIVSGLQAVAIYAQGLAWVIERIKDAINVAKSLIDQMKTINDLTGDLNFFENAGAVGNALGIPGFAEGGTVPGPIGAPQLAVVHGGETITPPGQGGNININVNGLGGADLAAYLEIKVNEALQEYTDNVLVPVMS